LVIGVFTYYGAQNRESIYVLLFSAVISIIVINVLMVILGKVLESIFNYLFRKYEKRKMRNYNLFEWMGESNWISLYDNLSEIKEVDKNSIYNNYEKIKEEIIKEFDTKNKLEDLKIFLEVKVESPRLTSIVSAIQTILLALITFSFVSYFSNFKISDFKSDLYLILGSIVWFSLLAAIAYLSKHIDKYRLLLKLVSKCIKEYEEKTVKDSKTGT
jgi:hypothetical protein